MDSISGHKIPVSAIIPTCNRLNALKKTLKSVSQQCAQPVEIIIIDASENDDTMNLCKYAITGLLSKLIWYKANEKGAALQRNQGTELAISDFILYLDDDIFLEKNCLEEIWNGIQISPNIGGVGAFVTNQKYQTPGRVTKFMYRLMSGAKLESYAGKCIGPAWNIWPEHHKSSKESIQVDWLSTVCVLYRRYILPQPVFPKIFTGYSYMEDVYLSLTVAKTLELHLIPNAEIFHDSQPGDHKKSAFKISKMQLVNRHFVMRHVMGRKSFKDYSKLFLLEVFFTISHMKKIKNVIPYFGGKVAGTFDIMTSKKIID